MSSSLNTHDRYDSIVDATVGGQAAEPVDPLWTVGNSEVDRLKWLNNFIEATEPQVVNRMEQQLINRFNYRAITWEADPTGFSTTRNRAVNASSKISVPDAYRYVENQTSRLLRFKAKSLVTPTTNEFQDKQGARIGKLALTSLYEQFDFDSIDRRLVRRLPLDGESFLLMLWDENSGAITERWRKANKKYGEKKVKFKKDGWVYDPDRPERVGDFRFIVPQPWEIRLDPLATCPEKCNFFAYIEHMHIEEIIAHHPKKEKAIRAAAETDASFGTIKNIDTSTAQQRIDEKVVPVLKLWHRSHLKLRKGAYIEAIPGLVLKDEDNPYSEIENLEETTWGDLPIEALTDIEIEGDIHGYASLNLINSFIRTRNQLLTSLNRNILLHGSPKFMIHRSAEVSVEALVSGATIVKWGGQVEPTLKNFGVIPPELVGFYTLLGEELEKAVNMHPISTGTPPKGIKAGVALRLLQEIEDKLFEPKIKKLNNFIVSRDKRALAYMGHFYKKEDNRFLHIVGEDNSDMLEKLDVEVLGRRYNIRLETVGAASNSAAARKQDVLDLLQYGQPNTLSPEQVLDALELNRPEKISDPAQTAVANAEYTIQLASRGKEIPIPRPGDNYLVHWKIYMAYYQRPGFRELPEAKQQEFIDMVTVLEFLMDEQALKNPAYDQVLLTQPEWPAFYHPSPRPQAPQQPQEGPPAQVNQQEAMQPPDAAFTPQPAITNDQIVS